MKQIEILNCGECPLSANGKMCSKVATETLQQLGYETSRDPRSASEIVEDIAESNENMRTACQVECALHIGRFVSTKSGYAPVVY